MNPPKVVFFGFVLQSGECVVQLGGDGPWFPVAVDNLGAFVRYAPNG